MNESLNNLDIESIKGVFRPPEMDLVGAMLSLAITDYLTWKVRGTGIVEGKSAEGWIFESRRGFFSFENVCLILGFDADRVRRMLLEKSIHILSSVSGQVRKKVAIPV